MKISILTPAFQSGLFLERAIQSVLTQDDLDFEHIIVDAGSSDGTLEILQKFNHIRWISEPDKGQSDAMNKAFALSTGDWIVYLNADDWFEPGVFQHLRSVVAKHPEADLVIGNLYIRGPEADDIKLIVPVKDYQRCLQFYRYRFPLNPVSYFYRRGVQAELGPFPIRLHYTMDYWFLLRALTARWKVEESDLVFGTFFSNGNNKTSKDPPEDETPLEIVKAHLVEFDPSSKLYFWVYWLWHRYVVEFPERLKVPIRKFVYVLFFRDVLSFGEYQKMGFRKAQKLRSKKVSNS